MSSTSEPLPPLHIFFDGRVPTEVARRVNTIRGWAGVAALALMPDAHPAGEACVGLIVATTHTLYPALVGEDIGCGMASVRVDLPSGFSPEEILGRLQRAVPIHRHAARQPLPDLGALSRETLTKIASRDGAIQFGTLGGGNDFLELQLDKEDNTWLTVHTGSRAMGAAVTDPVRDKPLHVDSPEGRAYLDDMAWCRRYAHASRISILGSAVQAMGGATDPDSLITCDHNHVSLETLSARSSDIAPHVNAGLAPGIPPNTSPLLFIHRKGATPAHACVPAVIAGSMGTRTFHVEGRGNAEALQSASHGAGRHLTRTQARQQVSLKELRREMRGVCYDRRHERELLEEAPSAYRDIRKVLRVQRELIKITRELRPLVVHKG